MQFKLRYIVHFILLLMLCFVQEAEGQVQRDDARILEPITTDSSKVEGNVLTDYEIFLRPQLLKPYQITEVVGDRIIVHNTESYAVTKYFEQNLSLGRDQIHVGKVKFYREKWVLFTSLFLILAFAIVRFFFSSDVKLIVQAYFNERIIAQVSKEDTIFTSWPFIFLYLLFALTLSLIVSVFYAFVLQRFDFLTFQNYLKVSAIIAIIFVLKIGFIRFIAFVMEIQKLVKEYVTILYLIYFNSLLFLLPLVLMVSLTPVKYLSLLFNIAIFIGLILFLYRFLRTAFNLVTQQRFSIFYLILYLCCLEIAPILILVRLLS